MKIIVSKNNIYLPSLQDDAEIIESGIVEINGVSYEVHPVEVDSIPDNAVDEEYIYSDGSLIPNPNYLSIPTIEELQAQIDAQDEILATILLTI